ncbi:MAG: pseudouridine synthase [Dehalococcoidia bacterium]
MRERLQKILAQAGFGSRRSAERLITAGRVSVNGATVSQLGAQADPGTDRIEVDGAPISLSEERVYLAMHKPYGYVTTVRDPQKRRTVMDLLPPGLPAHVVPVGRLDRDSEGLLLLTNDGELAHRLAHPRYQIDKEYATLVHGVPGDAAIESLRHGVAIAGRKTAPAAAEVTPRPPYGFEQKRGHTWLTIVIHEGRKRQVRLMCAAVGHPVRSLIRTRVGEVRLGRLARAKTRPLRPRELAALRELLDLT